MRNMKHKRLYDSQYYNKNRGRHSRSGRLWIKKNMDSWRNYFPEWCKCEMCGSKIYFSSGNSKTSINFDHRNGGIETIDRPSVWLSKHFCTPENRKIWESCNFGKLCWTCNKNLPTKNRVKFVANIAKYVLGIKL